MNKKKLRWILPSLIAIGYSIAQVVYKKMYYRMHPNLPKGLPDSYTFIFLLISITLISPFLIRYACLKILADHYASKGTLIFAAATMTILNVCAIGALFIFHGGFQTTSALFGITASLAIVIDLATSYLFLKNTKMPHKYYLAILIASILATCFVVISLW